MSMSRDGRTRVAVPRQDLTDGGCDLVGRKTGGCNLVQQGLEQMIILAADNGDVDIGPGECLGGVEAANARAGDHHTWPGNTKSWITATTPSRARAARRENNPRTSSTAPPSSAAVAKGAARLGGTNGT